MIGLCEAVMAPDALCDVLSFSRRGGLGLVRDTQQPRKIHSLAVFANPSNQRATSRQQSWALPAAANCAKSKKTLAAGMSCHD